MPCATFSPKRSSRAISAPRVQRVSIISWAMASPFFRMCPIALTRALQRGAARGMRENESQGGPETGGDRLPVGLEGEVVGPVEFVDPCRIAAAAEVLEQRGVIDRRAVLFRQPDPAGQLACDVAGADRMALRLSFGQVERIGEGCDDLRPADRGDTPFEDQFVSHAGRNRKKPLPPGADTRLNWRLAGHAAFHA